MNKLKNSLTMQCSTICTHAENMKHPYFEYGLFQLVTNPLFFFVWGSADNISLLVRITISFLCLFLVIRKYWPSKCKPFFPLYWYFTILYTLPFFFTFMLLRNNFSYEWVLNSLTGAVLFVLLVDFLSFLILTPIGILLGILLFKAIVGGPILLPSHLKAFLVAYGSVFVFGALFSRKRENFLLHEKIAAIKRISEEVAHDIRSPLTALRMATEHISILPEDQRVMIRTSTTRVNDIANNLLTNVEVTGTGHTEIRIPELLSSTLDRIVSEKRAQYSNQEITFDLQIPTDLFTIFVNVQPIELKRVLSNLINNSVEAFKKKEGTITLKLSKEGTHVSIHVIDNGCGISPALLGKIFEEKQSFGKKGGHGLGLSHAKRVVQLWEGEITVSSQLNHGTEIKIILPAEKEPPVWFAPAIVVSEKSTVVVIDDDDFIHLVWKERFKESLAKGLITLLSFYSLESFTEWFEKNEDPSYFLLMDYEFRNTEKTGVDSLKKLRVPSTQAVLVTSRYEEPDIRYQCKQHGFKIVPKNISANIPIKIIGEVMTITPPEKTTKPPASGNQPVDLILIDDNEALIVAWKERAVYKKKKMKAFLSIEAFLKEAEQYDKKTKIYVDSNLGGGVKGEVASEEIAKRGFKQIHLCTGFAGDPSKFAKYPWIKTVRGKEPPF